ncbi:MAG: response regulator, partial [Alphaproteobacteria bacterium]|nr:response regulator [Alphaproteobacteria bacterium]
EKGIDLVTTIAADLPDLVSGAPTRIRQILLNLVGNAVKFTAAGHVHLAVRPLHDEDGWARIEFAVTDTGIGIAKEKLDGLFQPFTQADSSTTRRFGGTGLGLSISRALVQMMDGNIGVESLPGEGSTFWAHLPLRVCPERRKSGKGQLAGKRVLVVSKSAILSGILERYLVFFGASVMMLETIGPRLDQEIADNGPIDFVLVDDQPPSLTVEKQVAAIPGSKVAENAKIVVMLPRAFLSQAKVRFPEAFALLPKPISRQALWDIAAAASGLVPDSTAQTAISRSGDLTTREILYHLASPELCRANGTMILVAEDNSVNQTVIRMLMEKLGFAIENVGNGIDASAALQKQDYGLLLTDCHMPEMDGFELTMKIRELEKSSGKHLPVIAVTADVMASTEASCRNIGMDACIKKPIGILDIEKIIRQFLPAAIEQRQRRQADGAKDKSSVKDESLRSPVSGAPVLDPSYLREMTGEDDAALVEILDDFLRIGQSLANDIERGVVSGDLVAARDAAHSLKGSARMAGALFLGEICAEIQDRLHAGDV